MHGMPCRVESPAPEPSNKRKRRLTVSQYLLSATCVHAPSMARPRQVQPRQLFVAEKVPGGLQSFRSVESSDVEMRFRWQSRDFTRQRGAALSTETAHRARRRGEFGDFAARHDIGAAIESNEHGNRCAAVL